MGSQNLPILYQNIMFGLKSDLGRDVFLWATERPGEEVMCYRAERFAHEVEQLVSRLRPILDAAARQHGMDAHDPDLMRFILVRHANWRFGGNLSPDYAQGVNE